jgi:TrmH family RNA methyltransferase
MMHIDSPSNPKIQQVKIWLAKTSARNQDNIVVVEGEREIARALKSGWHLRTLFQRVDCEKTLAVSPSKVITCSNKAFEKMVMRSQGVNSLAVFVRPSMELSLLRLPASPLIVVLDGLEKPGNVGAIMRSANAVGVDAVLFSQLECDPMSPQAIRNSLGGIFHCQTAMASREDCMTWLKANQITPVLMHLDGNSSHTSSDLSGSLAIVVGPEAEGLQSSWSESDAVKIRIPMKGVVDSLNVSVSTAVVLFEAVRQRDLLKK